jgi:hypothetical protein
MKKALLYASAALWWGGLPVVARLGGRWSGVRETGLALLVLSVWLVVWGSARDMHADYLAGSPEAPECPDWASTRQRRTWAVLHLLALGVPAASKRAVPAPPWRRREAE